MVKNQKIVLIGAGSLQFGLGSAGSILASEILEESTICLHDINEEHLKLANTACEEAIEKRELNFSLESTTDRKEALEEATFIINSIEIPPRFELWEQDYQIPVKYGNKQIFGENGGPGGLFHSLRIIPPILDICEDIIDICPKAFLINFSNPMSRVCLAVKRKFPSLKFVGLCHEFHFAITHLPRILDKEIEDLEVKMGGLNHFGILLDIRDKKSGEDLYPEVRKKGLEYLEGLNTLDVDLVKFILKHYGYLPYTTDSHYGEYIQWAYDVADLPGVKQFKEVYMASINYEGKKVRRLIKKGKGDRLVKPDDERAIPIIEGIISNDKHIEYSVNIPNNGIISNLPEDLVVECPAIINKEGVKGIKLGIYPKGLAALLRTQASVQDLAVEAAITNSKKNALRALLADPLVTNVSQAKKILEEFLETQSKYLNLK
ncbi:MAG: alpha-glucosidase [Candidatus Lokiarchaeota archaeon]